MFFERKVASISFWSCDPGWTFGLRRYRSVLPSRPGSDERSRRDSHPDRRFRSSILHLLPVPWKNSPWLLVAADSSTAGLGDLPATQECKRHSELGRIDRIRNVRAESGNACRFFLGAAAEGILAGDRRLVLRGALPKKRAE